MVNLGDFVQVFGKECKYRGDRRFDNLHEALSYCASDVRCAGIMDYWCDNQNEFYVCLGAISSSYETSLNCVYKKSEKMGEYNYVLKALPWKLYFSFFVLLNIQVSKIVILVFKEEFIHLKNSKSCIANNGNFLKNFTYPTESYSNSSMALNQCETYCSGNDECWGCSKDCGKGCNWTALSDCEHQRKSMEQSDTLVSQKPSNNSYPIESYSYHQILKFCNSSSISTHILKYIFSLHRHRIDRQEIWSQKGELEFGPVFWW